MAKTGLDRFRTPPAPLPHPQKTAFQLIICTSRKYSYHQLTHAHFLKIGRSAVTDYNPIQYSNNVKENLIIRSETNELQ
ncbi:MAG: hypothetical protein ACE3JN_05860 [Ectobacillus sp.]